MQSNNRHLFVSRRKLARKENVRQFAFSISFERNSLAKCTTRRFFGGVGFPVRQISISCFVSIACDEDNSSWRFKIIHYFFIFLPAIFFESAILNKWIEKMSVWEVIDNLDGVCEIQPAYWMKHNSGISYQNIDGKTLCKNIICCTRNWCFPWIFQLYFSREG